MPTDTVPSWDESISEEEFKSNTTPRWEQSKSVPQWDDSISVEEYNDYKKSSSESLRPYVPLPNENVRAGMPPPMPTSSTGVSEFARDYTQRDVQAREQAQYTPEQIQRMNEGGLAENILTAPPGIELPKISQEDVLKKFPSMSTGDADIVAGLARTGAGAWNTIFSPLGVATTPAIVAGGPAGKSILAGILADAIRHLPESVSSFHEAMRSGDPGKIAEASSALALQSGVIFGTGKGVHEGIVSGEAQARAGLAEDARQAGITESARALDQLAKQTEGAPNLPSPEQSAIAGMRPQPEAFSLPESLRRPNDQAVTEPPASAAPEGMVQASAPLTQWMPHELQLEVSEGVSQALDNYLLAKRRQAERAAREEGGQLDTSGEVFRSISETPGFEQTAEQRISQRPQPLEVMREVPEVTMNTPLQTVEEMVRKNLERRDWVNAVSTLGQTSAETSRQLVDKLLGVGKDSVPLTAGERLIFEETWKEALRKAGYPEEPLPQTRGLVEKLEALRTELTPGVGANPFPEIAKAVWNTAIDLAIAAVKAGTHIKGAIEEAVNHLKKNASGFDESKVREYLSGLLTKESANAASPPQRNTAIQQTITSAPAKAATPMTQSANKLSVLRQGFKTQMASAEPKSEITRTLDAADNEARIEGQQVGNSVRLVIPNPKNRAAVTFIVEANGNPERLTEFAAKVAGRNKAAEEAIALAQQDWQRLAPLADKVSQEHDAQLAYEQANGVDPGEVEGYVRHAYDMDAMLGRGRPVLLSNPKGGAGVSTSFKKQRTFQTYADAIEAGFKPRTFDVADLVESRITIGERLVNRIKWSESLSSLTDPVDNRPIVTEMVTQQPKGTRVAPMGYTPIQIMPGITVAVHEGYADLIGGLTGKSRISSNLAGRIILNTEAGIKHGLLALDTFHAGRMIYKELALTGAVKHDLGRSLLEYAESDLQKAVDAGEITQQAADWARANRSDAELLISQGLNVGRISDALYKDVVRNIPGIGTFNRWVFDKLTRGAMLQSAIQELGRLREALPDKSNPELAAMVSKNINEYYGNLGRQGLFSDPTLQDLARIVFLAPQWVEGMVRTEAGAVKQAAKASVDVARGKPLVIGTLAKGVGSGVLATLIANQLINMATRGHPTWQNPEHGHQLDAFIPDPTGKSPGFFLNPLSIFAEITHDALRYYNDEPHALKVAGKIIYNKMSPLSHALGVLMFGYNGRGGDLQGTWDRIKEGGKVLVPAPIPFQPALPYIGKNSPPGSIERQIFSSAGIKVEPAPSAESQLYTLARKFKEANNLPIETAQPSEYRDLNIYLRKEDWKNAAKEYELLIESKGEKTVRDHYSSITGRLFTGKRSTEAQFRQSLNEKDQELFDKAREERQALKEKFFELLTK